MPLVERPGGGQLVVHCLDLGGRGLGLADRGLVPGAGAGAQPLHPAGQVGAAPAHQRGRHLLGDVHLGGLGDPVEQIAHHHPLGLDPVARGRPLLGQPVLGAREPVDVEQRAQQVGPVLGLGPEEAGEVTLREQHHLAELVDVEPQPHAQVLGALVDPGAHRFPATVGQPLDGELRLLGGEALAPLLRPLLLGTTDHPDPLARQGQLAADLGARVRTGVVAAQPLLLAADAGDRAVEREDDRVEQRGLAGAGRAPQQEEPVAAHLVEVDLLRARERTEGAQGERVQPHRAASIRSAAPSARASSSRSAAVAATPRTCCTNSPATSSSVRPRSRSW